ncbi:helicase domain protein [Anaeromyxobacter dehalogenans 2CP-1]|uniref:Helicase domain protein n=1 Tax=Anaeromyxobacter dehalogenans (strain ATCC BAA-258 / DSM 21875 / 2CP-1) TaxID=455488 RepID=B8JC29_ANAD2|nr:SNF2-related protein [Anaeromyxobacter dehalogenans]ACL63951.1 helicase domain protein [Anaeromyxobacter dehalogenans 2CP-1]
MAWKAGMKVVHRAQRAWGVGVVVQVADEGRRLAVRFAGREGITVVSGRDQALVEVPADTPIEQVASGPIEALGSAQPATASAFALRTRVNRLEALRRADSLGALLSSRVHVLPHQVGAAGRILSDRMPRFVLADEVGLGKTVEAGLVFAGMRQLGLAERVLVVVPEHLAFQWLAELFHKFNALFALLTPERIEALGGPEAALARSPHAIVSFEALRADPDLSEAAADLPLDLVVVDEAHHLAEDALHDRVAPICRASFGVLLLTATPVRLDPREYFRLLSLVEPVPSTSLDDFLARLEQHEAYAQVARELLAGGDLAAAAERLRALAPDDPVFSKAPPALDRAALLAHLAERYGLSARLIRNRRVKVGAFTSRVLRRVDVGEGEKPKALVDLCAGLARGGEKVLVFGGDLEALRGLQGGLAEAGLEALLYDDAPSLEARDRLVARFRDPEGPMLLLSGESGGEGRNFQFAHHLVCADLPASPLVLEQRIGRLDRLGQTRPVEIHVPVEPGDEAFLADLYEKEIGIFDEPVGGLDAVLASLPEELAALQRKRSDRTRDAFRKDLAKRVAAARKAQHEGDPLLDIRSASLPELGRLVRGAFERMGEDAPEGIDGGDGAGAALEQSLITLSRWLEEELEDVCADVGRRVGMDVDTDQNVQPFEVSFTLGSGMRIEALPGMQIPDEPETFVGSFWRETAVARDELHWYATGHKLVEALLGLVRDGDAGRSAAVKREWAPRRGGLYARFEPRLATAADVAPGARVASRQASRYLDLSPIAVVVDLEAGNRVLPGAAHRLEDEIDDVQDARVGAPPPAALEAARAAAEREARLVMERRREEAVGLLLAHADAEEERLIEAAFAGGAPRERIDGALAVLRHHRDVVAKSIERVKLDLDAAALIVP